MSQSRREALRRQQEAQARAKRLNRMVLIGSIIVGVILVAVFGIVIFQQARTGGSASAPPNATAGNDGIVVNPGKATSGAPVVQLFVDYQCPVCKQFEERSGSVLETLAGSGQIQLEYRTMTFLDSNLLNDASTRAAEAAACADTVGVYPKFHDAIFAHQPSKEGDGYSNDLLRVTIPGEVGLTGDALTTFQKCYDAKQMAGFVSSTNDAASKAGVTGTPSLHINGKDVPFAAFFNATTDQLKTLVLAG